MQTTNYVFNNKAIRYLFRVLQLQNVACKVTTSSFSVASYVLQLQDSEKVSNNFIIKMTESGISLHAAMFSMLQSRA